MRAELWEEVEPILERALLLPEDQREAYLSGQETDHPEACREVRQLVAVETEVETFLERPAVELLSEGPHAGEAARDAADSEASPSEASDLGARLGPYRLVRVLGSGGMGTVYLGRREDEAFEAEVAVKILHRGLNARSFRRRFEQERQILASLQHPRIARLLDGGTTEDGRPYLVLERVQGRPIDRYCDEEGLGLRQRIGLMIQVCEAVDHAHRNLLVHRDLKPSNILVGEDGEPKLLDFGIAKILEEGTLPVAMEATAPLFRPMTLPYASPEQVKGEAVTTASDAYSLGVILYRLLTGQSPYRLRSSSRRELERAIREQPPRPAGEGAADRGETPRAWLRALEGDLGILLAKALHKSPERRYSGARELGEDLARILDHRPIEARPDSWAYRLEKLVRRNPWASGAAAAAALLLVLFAVVSTLQAERIRRERDAAVAARQESQQVTEFLVNLLKSGSPEQLGSEADLTVREVVQRSAEKLEDLSGQPALKAKVAGTLGSVYLELDLVEEAGPVVLETLELHRELYEAPHPAIAESLAGLAEWHRQSGELAAAEARQKEALEMYLELQGEEGLEVAKVLEDLGLIYYDQGRFREAAPIFRRALRIFETHPESDPKLVAEAHNNLAFDLHAVGDYGEAEASYRRALRFWESTGHGRHPFLAALLNNLASVLQEQGEIEEAEPLFRRSIAMRRELYGETHARVAAPMNKLAWMKMYAGQLEEAEELFDEALKLRRDHYGDDHPITNFSRLARARLWLQQGKSEAAEAEVRQAQARLEGKLPESHWRRRIGDLVLGGALLRQGRLTEAEPFLLAAYEDLESTIGAAEPRTRDVLALLIELYEARGDEPAATAFRRKVLPPAV